MTTVVISEILYNAGSSEATIQTQFIELINVSGRSISLNNWTLDDEDGDGPNILPDVTLNPGRVAIITGSSAADFEAAWGPATGYTLISLSDLRQTMFNLANSPSDTSEIVELRDAFSTVIDHVNYDDDGSIWPSDPDGFSIYLTPGNLDTTSNDNGTNWALSENGTDGAFTSMEAGVWNSPEVGSPGVANTVSTGVPSVLHTLVFNEVLADPNSSTHNFDTDGDGSVETADEFVEIYNTSSSTLNISGLQFWDSGSDNYFTVPNNTMLGPNGFVVVVANTAGGSLPSVTTGSFAFSAGGGLSLSNTGDNLVLFDPATDQYIQAIYNGDGIDDPETMPNGNYVGFSTTATRLGSVLDFGNDTDGVSLALSPDGVTGNSVQHNTIGDRSTLATPGTANLSNASSGTTLAIANLSLAEGDSGITTFNFTVTRSGDTSGTTTVNFTTADGTAVAGSDYTASTGTLTFNAGDTAKTITIDAIGDTAVESNETFTVTLSDPSGGATLTTAVATGTIPNDDVTITKIHAIQGTTDTTLLDNQVVTIEAIVVGDFQDGDADTSRNLRGFYVQEEDSDADGNALTSEGLFIFENSNFITDVNIGDLVQITGTVDEFFGETQLDTITDITVVSSGNLLPTAATITLPSAATTTNQDGGLQPDLEAFEGMRVNISETLTITDLFQLDRFNEIKLSQGGRLEQFTQNNTPDVTGYSAHLADISARTITYDDGLSEQNAAIAHLDGFGSSFNTATDIRTGDTIDNLSGVLSYQWAGNSASGATWRMRSTQNGENTFTKVNNRPTTPDDVGGSLKVANVNLLNYFTTLNEGSNTTANGSAPRGADNATEFARQTDKLVTALQSLDADIISLAELENDFQVGSNGNAIATLVDELNAVVGAGTYAWVNPGTPFVGDDAIAVGFIYKTASVGIASGTTVEMLTDADLPGLGLNTLPAVFDGGDTNRSPLAVTFEQLSTGERFTAVANHLKSKGSVGTAGTGDEDQNDGAGFSNQTRLNGVTALNAWLATDPTGSGDDDFLILGDLNAYAEEVPITFLEGQGYTDLAQQFQGAESYSFVFDGQSGTLDYGLANASLLAQVTGATEWHINADEADALDYNTNFGRDINIFDSTVPYRTSDHDPLVIGLNLNSTVPPLPVVSLSLANAPFAENGGTATVTATLNTTSPSDVINTASNTTPTPTIPDTTPPQGTIAPPPVLIRNTALDNLQITFDEAIANFDLADVQLTRDSTVIELTGVTLTTTDTISWTLVGLSSLTIEDGNYAVTLVDNTDVTDISGNPLTTNISITWQTGQTGTGRPDIDFSGGNQGRTHSGSNQGDRIIGTPANDVLRGGNGNDRIIAGFGKKQFGKKQFGHDRLFGGGGNDVMKAGAGKDFLSGGTGRDRLFGGRNDDELIGGNGNDLLNGGKGDDVLNGGLGRDRLKPGPGRDTLVYRSLTEGIDTVIGFNVNRDLLDLSEIFSASDYAADNTFAQYVNYIQIEQVGGATHVTVDSDGSGTGTEFTTLVKLQGIQVDAMSSRNFVMA